MTIIEALRDPNLLGASFPDLSSRRAWQIYLRALFGLGLEDEKGLALFRECTGRETLPEGPVREGYVIAGRRSGKSTAAATIAVYLGTLRDWKKYLGRGERGWIFILSVDKLQSRVIKGYVEGILHASKYFRNMISKTTAEEIWLKSGVVISVKTSNFRSVRGYTLIAAILEELAFWRGDETCANPDREIVTAVRPALATIPESLLIGISSPYMRSGVLYDQFRKYYGQADGPLIWKAPSRVMNPTLDVGLIDRAIAEDVEAGRAEWEAEWRADISQFIPLELVEAAVIPGRYELPRVEGASYRAFADPSGGRSDSFTLAISHLESSGKVALDVLREARPPFRPESVTEEFSTLLKSYGVYEVGCDRYAGEWVKDAFSKNGIQVRYSEKSASELYLELLPLLAGGRLELVDNKRLVSQLTTLERRTRSGGKDIVTHYQGGHDDLANACAGACVSCVSAQTIGWYFGGGADDEEEEEKPALGDSNPKILSPKEIVELLKN